MALLIGLCLLVTLPVLIHGAPDRSDDGILHAIWAKQFATQFWQGDRYPRWFTNANGGFGGPSGFFYPPLVNYASALFWPFMAARDPKGWLVAGYAIVLAQVLSGITAYWWLRSITQSGAALLGAAVYVIAPYHLAIDVYQRGAAAELWVFVWFPLVLLSAEGILRRSKWALPGAAVSYVLALLSHPTVTLCFTPIPLAYLFCFSQSKERARTTARFAAALLLGVGLSAAYLLPAMLDQSKTYASLYLSGWGNYHNHWLWQNVRELADMARYLYGTVAGTHLFHRETARKMQFLLVTLATLSAIVAWFLPIRSFEPAGRSRRIAVFYLSTALLYFFLMTRPSLFIWETVPILKDLQYPFRLNVMLVVCVALLASVAGPYLLQSRARAITLLLALIVTGWLGADVWAIARAYPDLRSAPQRSEERTQWIRMQMDPPEMWPKPSNVDLSTAENFAAFHQFVAIHPPRTAQLEALSTGRTRGTARVESWQPRRVVLKIEAPRDSRLTLNHFYYAGWQGRIEGAATNLTAGPSPDGLIQMDVPKGDYDLIIELPQDSAERSGTVISLISLLLLGGAAIWGCLAKKSERSRTVTT
jgi:hypothetical protein